MNFKFISLFLTMVSLTFPCALYAQRGQVVSGKVTDSDGQALPGVIVISDKAPGSGTTTGLDGLYSINAGQDATLTFKCMGFTDHSEKVGSRTEVNVTMNDDNLMLEETVVIGYGVQRKVDLTGSVAVVDFGKTSGGRSIVSPSAALAGTAAGMTVTQGSGQPGKDAASIVIRGLGSFSTGAVSPLVLVDGVEWNLDNVNPNDIASISVLKDAASISIYGTRGANGVILITTKSGEEAKTSISYSFKGIRQTAHCDLRLVSDYADHMSLMNEACDNVETSRIFSQSNIDLWREAKKNPNALNANGIPNYVAYPNTDWFEELFQPGFSQEHNLTISGGSKKIHYLMSGGYLDNEGVMGRFGIDSSTKKYHARINLDSKINDWITAGARVFAMRQTYGLAGVSGAFGALYQTTPGIYIGTVNAWGTPALNSEESTNANNIFANLYGAGGYNVATRINGSAFVKFQAGDFSLEATGIYTPAFAEAHSYTRPNGRWNYTDDVQMSATSLKYASSSFSTSRNYALQADLLARYTKEFGIHKLQGLLGYSARKYEGWGWGLTRRNATDWSMNDLDTYSEPYSYSNTPRSGFGTQSVFGRVNYNFDDKYLLEANFRVDGSSRFGPGKKYGFFPSVSAGWRIDRESFMEGTRDWLSALKLRASWGRAGNDNGLGNYSWQASYSTTDIVLDGEIGKGLYIAALGNDQLGWETTTSTDIGLDASFLDGKITMDIDWYHRRTTDILYTPTIYYTMGEVSGAPANVGSLWNSGVELALTYKGSAGKDFSWELGMNASYNKNMVSTFLGPLVKEWRDGKYYNNLANVSTGALSGKLVEGHMIGEHYLRHVYHGNGKGYVKGGVNPKAGPVDGVIRTETDFNWVQAMMDSGYTFAGCSSLSKDQLWYGDIIYEDADGDRNYGDDDDCVFNGHSTSPAVTLGINAGVSWKNFDFSMTWSGAFGFWIIWNSDYYNGSGMLNGYALAERVASDHYFYDPSNPSDPRTNQKGYFPRLTYGTDVNNRIASDYWEYKGDYLKLKTIQLGYTLPRNITGKAKISGLRFFLSGENLLTITSYPGLDPEIGAAIGYPLMRQFTLGGQITF